MIRFRILLAMCLTLTTFVAAAQGNVSGVVKDRNGEPLIGANVYVKGTTISTITGINGEFNIKAADDAVVVISFEGYQPMEVAVADLATANLQLKPENVIGIEDFYGNNDYYALTTASTLIVVDDISTGLEADIHEFLLGRVPGLEVVDGQYRLRGGNSLTGWDEVQPLFVVDGAYGLGTDIIIGSLNPADIESIRVLKDAAATAQYGMWAKGGAIVIKTRRPSDKVLAVSYDGNASHNKPSGDDNKWEPYNSAFDNTYGTKHNLGLSGVAVDLLPYRISLGYNKENTILKDCNSNRFSASLWVGPRLLDKHLSIDVNGAYRKIDTDYDSYDLGSKWLSGTFNVDYAVHSFEALHLNIKANTVTNFDGYEASLVDGYASLQRQSGKRRYLELRAGAALGKAESDSEEIDTKSVYGQFNMAVNRFFMNAHARVNTYSFDKVDYSKLSMAVSFGVKPINLLTVRSGLGFLGIGLGDQPDGVSSLSTFTYNFGIDVGTQKSRVNGSADFYYHINCESPYINKDAYLNNVGAEYRVDAKIIDTKNFKFRIGGTLSCNFGIDFEENDNNDDEEFTAYISIGGYEFRNSGDVKFVKAYTYGVFDPVYDQDGNRIPGMYVDYDGDGTLSGYDRISSQRSPVPTVMGGLNTYLEVMGAYLQLNAHTSLDRQNVSLNNNDRFDDTFEGNFRYIDYPSFEENELITSDDIHNSSFLRIDNVVLGYKIPNLGKAYLAVQNPYIFTKYDGREPEIFDGYDNVFLYRRPTTFTVGLKLNINIKD